MMELDTEGETGGVAVIPRSDPQKLFWKPIGIRPGLKAVIPSRLASGILT